MHFPLYQWIATASEILVIGYALWRGERPERLAGLAALIAIILTPLSQDHRFLPGPQWALSVVDTGLLVALAWIGVRSGRLWVLASAGFQLLDVACHVVLLIDPSIRVWIYIAFMNLLGYGMLASIAMATWQADRRRRLAASSATPAR